MKKREVYKPEQQLTIRLPLAEREKVRQVSKQLGVSQSMLVRAATRMLLAQVENDRRQ